MGGAVSLVVEASKDGVSWVSQRIFDDLNEARFQEGSCMSVVPKGSDLVTIDRVSLESNAAGSILPHCTNASLEYARSNTLTHATITGCTHADSAGTGNMETDPLAKTCTSALDGDLSSIWSYHTGTNKN